MLQLDQHLEMLSANQSQSRFPNQQATEMQLVIAIEKQQAIVQNLELCYQQAIHHQHAVQSQHGITLASLSKDVI